MNKQALLVIAALQSFYCNSILLGSNPPKHLYHVRLMFKGIQLLRLCQRKQIIFQRCSVCCALRGGHSTQLIWVFAEAHWFISVLVSPWTSSRKRKTEVENWKKREAKLLLLYTALLVTQCALLRENCGRSLCFPSNILNTF